MKFLTENWFIIVAGIAALAVLVYLIYKFMKLPRASQIAKLKEWLLYAVALAEKELGSGTGQLKLRYVYDMFVSKFPYLVQFITFEAFGKLVDEVLVKFKEMFNSNKAVKLYVDSAPAVHKDAI
jgi:hypothetical protein